MKARVWNSINFERMDFYTVESVEEAIVLIDNLADAQLKNEAITDNAFGLEVFEDGEWNEYYNEFGDDIHDIRRQLEEEAQNE